jgi:excisionase family DNA binding protein
MAQSELMTATEAQAYLGISTKTLARLLKSGELPYTPDKLDRRVKMVRRADVEALAHGSTKPGKDAA